MASKEHKKRLQKLKRLACNEIIDGCQECCHLERSKRRAGGVCDACLKKCIAVITDPKKALGKSGFLS